MQEKFKNVIIEIIKENNLKIEVVSYTWTSRGSFPYTIITNHYEMGLKSSSKNEIRKLAEIVKNLYLSNKRKYRFLNNEFGDFENYYKVKGKNLWV